MADATPLLSPGTKILIVDDNPQYTQLLTRILSSGFGFTEISTVDSTQEAYDVISKDPERFKLLFIDYRFPVGTGGELLTKLKENALLADKVAFLITSEPTVDNQKEALRAGASGVVAKPFDRGSIRAQLEKADRAIRADSGDSF